MLKDKPASTGRTVAPSPPSVAVAAAAAGIATAVLDRLRQISPPPQPLAHPHKWVGDRRPYSITERRVPELILVLGSQPAGDVSHKPGGRLPLLSARHAVTPHSFHSFIFVYCELSNRSCTQK